MLQSPLFYPFENGDLDLPVAGQRALFLGASVDARAPTDFLAVIDAVQGYRPAILDLSRNGWHVTAEAAGAGYDLALIQTGRHRGQNENWIAEAIQRLKPQGLVLVAGGKNEGISSLRKRLSAPLAIAGHRAKHHGEVFWLSRTPDADAWAAARLTEQAPLVEGRFYAAPGMFSHERVDVGSRLLSAYLPDNLKGLAADFCAGWGYLSVALAERAPGISGLELFEADHASLEAAKINMAALAPGLPAAFHWIDLAREPVERRFDVIVMNPPFHQGRAAEPDVGLAMIRAASKALKPGGQLFMVANRGLPYEAALKSGFGRVEELADQDGFRIWKARR